ncbi:MAG: hypothetical protein KatS3mg104_0168 [Phycisphaerae bacterium]|jgi:hypothetical protein|nr:MAG: hypothetical protein KatS3mg104_0168 [Phycisphaerae bacterium]
MNFRLTVIAFGLTLDGRIVDCAAGIASGTAADAAVQMIGFTRTIRST